MVCKNCKKEFLEDWRKGQKNSVPLYCSRACSNKRVWTSDHKENLSSKMRKGPSHCEGCGNLLSAYARRNKLKQCRICLPLKKKSGKYGIDTSNINHYLQESHRVRREECIRLLGGCCQKCAYYQYSGALEFHHRDPTQKDFNLSKRGMKKSWYIIENELQKCILLCCRCHRELHEFLRNKGNLEAFLSSS